MISRVILTGYRLADGVEVDFYYTNGLGWTSRPDDTPANTFFVPRLRSPLSHAVEAWDGDRLGGVVRSSLGAIELGNEDGALSYLLHEYAFAGRAVQVFLCDEGQAQADVSPFWSGLVDRVDASDDGIEIRVVERHKLFEVDLYQAQYAGDNVAPEGIEGDETLQDKPKPVALGICRNISPVLVNSQKLIYQVHWRSIQALDAVYDKGVALGAGSNYADAAALQAASPTPGTYDTCLAEGLLRLGSSPVGQITADVRGDNVGGYVDSPAGIVTRLLEDYALLDEPVDTSAVVGISWPLGLYAAQEA
ncbi:hypothetical protein, partial [Desulfovibrio inopinatus]|uniref:hypothetical protein n=1 Tax=Desulfovibrio inopinatus TaxID=102109 RepID=UPI001B7FAB68